MNLIETLIALRNSDPGTQSQYLHSEFKRNLERSVFDVDKLHTALDEAKLKSELGIEIISILSQCIGNSKPEYNIEVDTLIKCGQYIQAIKLHRSNTGLGLAESKQYVDNRKMMLNVH